MEYHASWPLDHHPVGVCKTRQRLFSSDFRSDELIPDNGCL